MRPAVHFLGLGRLLSLSAAGTAFVCSILSAREDPAAQEAADRVRTKVVIVKTSRPEGQGAACGFLAAPMTVLTAGHIVENARGITALVNGVAYRADITAAHPEHDLALLALRAPQLLLKPAELCADLDSLRPAESLLVLAGAERAGRARGEPRERLPIPAQFEGRRLVRQPGTGRLAPVLSLRASVERGDSGSPVIRIQDGTVVGVLVSRELPDASGVSRTAYAVPSDVMRTWIAAERLRLFDTEKHR
jgi:S1-C subfamily serine protease